MICGGQQAAAAAIGCLRRAGGCRVPGLRGGCPVAGPPLSRSQEWLGVLQQRLLPEQPLVVLCHAGIRSHHFGLWLMEQNWGLEVWNLEGGIDAWSVQVDPTVPRY